jgi:hypothetical protein
MAARTQGQLEAGEAKRALKKFNGGGTGLDPAGVRHACKKYVQGRGTNILTDRVSSHSLPYSPTTFPKFILQFPIWSVPPQAGLILSLAS